MFLRVQAQGHSKVQVVFRAFHESCTGMAGDFWNGPRDFWRFRGDPLIFKGVSGAFQDVLELSGAFQNVLKDFRDIAVSFWCLWRFHGIPDSLKGIQKCYWGVRGF